MKLVRIKINNRVDRVFNFDDHPTQSNNHYIIRNGNYGEPRELFSIEEGAVIIDGRSVEPLSINKIEKAETSNTLIVTLGKRQTCWFEVCRIYCCTKRVCLYYEQT